MRWLLYLVIAGCWSAPSTTPEAAQPTLTLSEHGAGMITAKSTATLVALRETLPKLRVVPKNDPNLEFDLYDDNVMIGYVVPNDDGSVFNVQVSSDKVVIEGKPWRAGQPFQSSKGIDTCECWGENPTCYRKGEHLAVSFARSCFDSEDTRSYKALDGLVVQRVIWSVTPFGS